ncbi:MAG: arginase family protein [Cyclobacteriaceae bacterium]|nr:arginase family protein [Cyclobacteriaceae bacterium]
MSFENPELSAQFRVANKELVVIKAPSNLGLKKMKYADANGPGVRKMPQIFDDFKFSDRLGIKRVISTTPAPYRGNLDKASGIRNVKALIEYSIELSSVIEKEIVTQKFPIVIGGDCSILIAPALALRRIGEYGLVHIDGHTDFAIGNKSSATGGAAGMDLALVTGRGHSSLTNLQGLSPYLKDFNTGQFGNRSNDVMFNGDFYDTEIYKADLAALRKSGIKIMAQSFVDRMRQTDVKGFWIHVDLDVLHDSVMSAVDSRQADGLYYNELSQLIKYLLDSGFATGIQFTIYDPDLDNTKEIGKRLVDELVDIFAK